MPLPVVTEAAYFCLNWPRDQSYQCSLRKFVLCHLVLIQNETYTEPLSHFPNQNEIHFGVALNE